MPGKPLRLLLPVLGCCAVLAFAQERNDDTKTNPPPPPTKGGVPAPDERERSEAARSDRPAAVNRRDEVITDVTQFNALDTDGDDRISRAEFTLAPNLSLRGGGLAGDPARPPSPGERMAAGTTDSNFTSGRGANPSALFDRIDTDKDGFISKAELAVYHSNNQLPK